MSVTSTAVFDNQVFDGPNIFDTKLQYLVNITVSKQIFDDALFDSEIFDISRGGVIDFSDSAGQSLQSQRNISTSISLSDVPGRILASLRSITASSISLSDSASRVMSALRNISQSISIGSSITYQTPDVRRYIRDLGAIFDSALFGNNTTFDTAMIPAVP